jgi:hypothetical protein
MNETNGVQKANTLGHLRLHNLARPFPLPNGYSNLLYTWLWQKQRCCVGFGEEFLE